MTRLVRIVTVDGTPDAIAAWRRLGYRAYLDKIGVRTTVVVAARPLVTVDVLVEETVDAASEAETP